MGGAPRGVLSVDIARRRYQENGIAFLPGGAKAVEFPQPADLGLMDPPEPEPFGRALDRFCRERQVDALLLDGSQGWRQPGSQIEHMRLCERVLNTPGKTGVPGEAKPGNYLPYIQFSIDLYHHLMEAGWKLLTADWHRQGPQRWLVETFPTSAWKTLGLDPLPGKARTKKADLQRHRKALEQVTGLDLQEGISHDQLQAAVVLPVGMAIVAGEPERILLSGTDPYMGKHGNVMEGWIANPLYQS